MNTMHNLLFYPRLARTNMKKNSSIYYLMVGKHNEPVFFGQVFHAMGFNCHAACLIGGEGCLFTPPEAFLIADAFMDTAPPDVAEIINGFKKKPEDHQGYSTHI